MKLPLKIFLLALVVVLGSYGVARVCGWCDSPAIALSKWRAGKAIEEINRSKDFPGKGNSTTPQPDNFYNLGKALRTYDPDMPTAKMTLMGIAVDSLRYNNAQGYFELSDENREALRRFFVGNNDLAVVEDGTLRKVGKCICSVQCGELFGESPLPTGEEFVWMDGKFTSVGMGHLVFEGTINTRFKDMNGGAAYAQVSIYNFAVYEDGERGVVCKLTSRHPYQGERDILILLNKDTHAPSTHLTEEEVAQLVGYDIDDPTAYHQDHTKFYAKLDLDNPVKPTWKTVTAEVGDTTVCYARCKHLIISDGKSNKVLEKINHHNYELVFEQYADSEKIDIVGALGRMFRGNFENELKIAPEDLIGKPLFMWIEQSAKTVYGGKILRIVTENTLYLGGSHEFFHNEIHQYNLTTGELIDLSYLHEGEWVNRLDKAIYDHLPDFTRPHKDTPDNLTEYAEIMITDGGLLFQYKPYEVASFADGFVEVEITNEELASLGVPMPWR